MKKLGCLLVCAWLACAGRAQTQLPPVWGDASHHAQYSSRTIAYLSPTRIVWQEAKDGATIQGIANLLKPGNGQAELVQGSMCRIKNGEKGKASFLLDFGRELQGGIQIVTGMSP